MTCDRPMAPGNTLDPPMTLMTEPHAPAGDHAPLREHAPAGDHAPLREHAPAGDHAPLREHAAPDRVLIIGCGALARELLEIAARNAEPQGTGAPTAGPPIDVECLPAKFHNRPEQIAPAVRSRLRAAKASGIYRTILVGYMDCGTGGVLDRVCAEEGVQRLPGAHCYEMYAGAETFAGLQDPEPGTFYLTDYLVKHFDRLIMDGLGITRHPQLLETYFGHYTRVVHLAQSDDPDLARQAKKAADQLGLRCEHVATGIAELYQHVVRLSNNPAQTETADRMDGHRTRVRLSSTPAQTETADSMNGHQIGGVGRHRTRVRLSSTPAQTETADSMNGHQIGGVGRHRTRVRLSSTPAQTETQPTTGSSKHTAPPNSLNRPTQLETRPTAANTI